MAAIGERTATEDQGSVGVPTSMKAVVYSDYGGPEVLAMQEVPVPTPGADEVLIRVEAASVNAGDWHLMRGTPFLIRLIYGGYRRPKFPILGVDISGRVAAIGEDVTAFHAGDEVLVDLSEHGFGGFAEYVCVPESALVSKPGSVSFERAATIPTAAVAALQGLRDAGRLQVGERVLINGASGGVGTFAVQIAKHLGADVNAVCSSSKMEVVRSIGADHVIDYTREGVTTTGTQYDLILDTAGSHSMREFGRALRPSGRYVMVGGPFSRFLQAIMLGPLLSAIGRKEFVGFTMKPDPEDLRVISGLLESGAVTPVIDRTYPLEDVPEAIRYVESGRAVGKVVIA